MTAITILDDELVIARSCTRYLRDYNVTCHTDAAEALEAIVASPPDLLLLDYYLTDTTGAEVIAKLRARQITVPILLMSGSFDAHRGAEEFSFGADDVIAKPFTREALVTKIERLIAAHALHAQVERQHEELRALHERREAEADAARALFQRMLARGQFDPATTRRASIACGDFAGDAVLAADLDGRYRWMVADVTGHTLASALVTIPVSLVFYATARKQIPLREVLETFDRNLAELLPVTMFCAGTLCELDRERGELHVWNGGAPPVLVRRASGEVIECVSDDVPLGVMRGPRDPHAVTTVAVAAGDRIYTLSDGLTDARSPAGELLGAHAIARTIAASSPEVAYDAVLAAWREHVAGRAPDDDISLFEVVV